VAASCDGSTDVSPAEMTRAQTGGGKENTGDVKVAVVINHNPILQQITSDMGRVTDGVSVAFAAKASDPDGDTLTFRWSTACSGAFSCTTGAHVTFTPSSLSTDETCEFDVWVADPKGGTAYGSLSLSSAQPVLNVAPQMGLAWQSTAVALAGETVSLHATAVDPEGEALLWIWTAQAGELGEQKDLVDGSDMTWTAPLAAGGAYTVTAMASDPLGAGSTSVFTIDVVVGQTSD
jgi:hypothetical protein